MSCRTTGCKRFMLTLSLVAMPLVVLGLTQPAFAVGGVDDPALVFQLEGNVTNEGSVCFLLNANGAFTAVPTSGTCPSGYSLVTFGTTTDDWVNIATPPNHAVATSFISPNTSPAEAINSNSDSIFTGGGSKDISGISSWAWKNGKPQGKDDIEHAFAAAYTLPGILNGSPGTCGGANEPGCDTAVYFGMTRFDNSGDSTAGFWFFQDGTIGLAGGTFNANKDPICGVGSGCSFSGHHTNNDLLIVSDFSTGGPIATIQVFKWSCSGTGATCDSTGSLVAATSLSTAAECNPAVGTSGFCAITNGTAGLSVPFGFANKSGQTTLDHGELLEGGINLNVIFPDGLPCFSTFMAETRSSNSPTSTLSDLTPPVSFPLCGMSISKQCDSASYADNGTDVQYNFSGVVKNTGIGNLTNVVVSDTPGANLVANSLVLNQPDLSASGGILAPGATVTYNGSFKASVASSTEGNTATVNAKTEQGVTVSPASASWIVPPATGLPSSCIPPVGQLALDKSCTAAVVPVSGGLEIAVNFGGNITNNSNVRISGISVSDAPTPGGSACASSSISVTYPVGQNYINPGQVATYSGCYTPTSCVTNDNGVCAFSDTASSQGIGSAGVGTINSNSQGATCHLCPTGVCSTGP